MAEVLRCQDRWGRDVVLHDSCWDGHVISGHPEMDGNMACVLTVIKDPHCVTHDVNDADGENFYRAFTLPAPFDRSYLKVCVRYQHTHRPGTTYGVVVTAYSTSSIKQGERVKWEQ